MNEVIEIMIDRYHCESLGDYKNALKEILQEIVLLGLWRSKFFEHAAFYGGTALRILYGLDRFSEDLDFSLLKVDPSFQLASYEKAVKDELNAFGFDVWIEHKEKNSEATIQSAFVKANTLHNLLKIDIPEQLQARTHLDERIKIKFEIDVNPPLKFSTESKPLLRPAPFSVRTYVKPDLFAGKMHALLCRRWQNRVKGRDWYDLIWYLSNEIPLNLKHLEERMKQTEHLSSDENLTRDYLIRLILEKLEQIDIELARKDVIPLLRDPSKAEVWSKDFFQSVIEQLKVI